MICPSFRATTICLAVLGCGLACERGSNIYGTGQQGTGGSSSDVGLGINLDQGDDLDGRTNEVLPDLTLSIQDDELLPLTNGILTLDESGERVLASDAEGHTLYLVHPEAPVSITKIALGQDFPGRVVTSADRAFVLLRRSGRVAVVDLASATVTNTLEVCRLVEGLVVDGDQFHVACRDGELVSYDLTSLAETRRLLLDDDLRDVARRGAELVVSRFRSAELLFLDADGAVAKRISPQLLVEDVAATQLSRFVVLEDGKILAAVQASLTVPVRADGTASRLVGSYGGISSCGSIATPAFVVVDPDALDPAVLGPVPEGTPVDQRFTAGFGLLQGTAGMLDFTVVGSAIQVVVPANGLMTPEMRSGSLAFETAASMPSRFSITLESLLTPGAGCLSPLGTYDGTVQLAVASNGPKIATLVASPLRLQWYDGTVQQLDESPRDNTGFRLFHVNTGIGISCASCHPEGREDGHTWSFIDIGLRRTQNLEGGFEALAPFHWDAEFSRFDVLLEDVMVHRMGLGHHLSAAHVAALAQFIDSIPAPTKPSGNVASERGQQVFAVQNCADCHEGARFSDAKLHDAGTGGEFVTPPLGELVQRAPYLHDGCAATTAEVFGPCGGTAHDLELSAGDLDDLVAYLGTL